MSTRIARLIAAIGFLLFGAISFFEPAARIADTPVDLASISHTQLEDRMIYRVDRLVMVDTFASRDQTNVDYFVTCYESQGKNVAVNMPINPSTPFWSTAQAYLSGLSNGTRRPGDFVVSGYVQARRFYTEDESLLRFFRERVWDLTLEGLDLTAVTGLQFDYVCSLNENPMDFVNGVNNVGRIFGAVSMGVGLLFAFLALKPKKR